MCIASKKEYLKYIDISFFLYTFSAFHKLFNLMVVNHIITNTLPGVVNNNEQMKTINFNT